MFTFLDSLDPNQFPLDDDIIIPPPTLSRETQVIVPIQAHQPISRSSQISLDEYREDGTVFGINALLFMIFDHFSPHEVVTFASTCQRWNTLINPFATCTCDAPSICTHIAPYWSSHPHPHLSFSRYPPAHQQPTWWHILSTSHVTSMTFTWWRYVWCDALIPTTHHHSSHDDMSIPTLVHTSSRDTCHVSIPIPSQPLFSHLTSLYLTNCVDVHDTDLAHITSPTCIWTETLTNLDLTNCRFVTDTGVSYLPGLFRLTTLSLAGTAITDKGLSSLPLILSLTHLNLATCVLTDTGLTSLSLCRLSHLNLNRMRNITDMTIQRICQRDKQHTSSTSSSTWILPLPPTHIDDDMIMNDISIPSLDSLSMPSTSHDMDMMLSLLTGATSDDTLSQLSTSTSSSSDLPHPSLFTHLYLAYAYPITDLSLSYIATSSPLLHTLDLTHCDHITDTGITSIISSCYNIHTLILSGCHQVTDVGVSHIITSQAICKTLQHLEMASIPHVTSSTWIQLCKYAQHLTYLNLSFTSCNDDVIKHITHHIIRLELDSCYGISDTSMMYLSHCISLTHLDLTACALITSKGIQILSTFISLSWLSLAHIPCIDDRCMSDLTLCHTLRHLSVQSCINVTRDGINHFRAHHGRVGKRRDVVDSPCICHVMALHA